MSDKYRYEFWDRIVQEFTDAVEKAQAEGMVNEVCRVAAINMRAKYPKPKSKPTEFTTSSTE